MLRTTYDGLKFTLESRLGLEVEEPCIDLENLEVALDIEAVLDKAVLGKVVLGKVVLGKVVLDNFLVVGDKVVGLGSFVVDFGSLVVLAVLDNIGWVVVGKD